MRRSARSPTDAFDCVGAAAPLTCRDGVGEVVVDIMLCERNAIEMNPRR